MQQHLLTTTNFLRTKQLKAIWRHRNGIAFNDKFFDQGITSRFHAWFLGWAYGDGSICTTSNVNKFSMYLQLTDVDVLCKLLRGIDSDHFISIGWTPSEPKQRPNAMFRIYNDKFASSLESLGCFAHKCNTITFPQDIVPQEYMWDFVRGYFEADGTLSLGNGGRSRLAFQATCHDFLNDLNDFISQSIGIEKKTLSSSNYHHANHTVNQMGWYRADDISNIISLMYPHDTYCKDDNGIVVGYDFCERKFNRCKYFQTISDLSKR